MVVDCVMLTGLGIHMSRIGNSKLRIICWSGYWLGTC